MALKLLQPSLRPLGQFDLADDTTVVGGEIVSLASVNVTSDNATWGSHNVGPLEGSSPLKFTQFAPGEFENGKLCGLADDGTEGYGTQFGTLIGGSAGQGVQVPTNMGAVRAGSTVVIGPQTTTGSGKVTVWHSAGLYSVNQAATSSGSTIDIVANVDGTTETTESLAAATFSTATAANSPVFAHTDGKLFATAAPSGTHLFRGGVNASTAKSDQCAIYVGYITDSSLVSTPATLAGTADYEAEEYAIYFLGNQGLI